MPESGEQRKTLHYNLLSPRGCDIIRHSTLDTTVEFSKAQKVRQI
jgi:hypothetical protein